MEEARNEEERIMLEDVSSWMSVDNVEDVLDWQGATALHVAAAKGYNKVISLLLQIRNSNGQAPYELAEKDFMKTVDQCKKRSKDILKNNVNNDPGSLMVSAQRAISLLNKAPPFPIVKGSRKGRDITGKTDNDNVSNSVDSQSESDSEPEPTPPPKKEVPPPVSKPAEPPKTTATNPRLMQ